MGFVAEALSGEKGIQVYYIIGILIFIGLFGIILYRTMTIRKTDIVKYKSSILDSDESDNNG